MFITIFILLNFILGTRRVRSFRSRSFRRNNSIRTYNFRNETFYDDSDSSMITSKNGEASTKQVKRIESYLYALVRDKVIFRKERLTRNLISSLTAFIHYSFYLQTDETLRKFLEEETPHFTERRNNIIGLFLLNRENIKKTLSEDVGLNNLLSFKFYTAKINKKCRKDPTILEFADEIISYYTLNEKKLDAKKCHSQVCLILYKLKKYYKAQ